MSLFRVFVDGQLFYHPHLSQLAITKAELNEDAESIDSLVLAAPFSHPYISAIKPMSSTIVCKKDENIVFEGRALDDGSDFYNTHTWTCESCLAYLNDSLQAPYDYSGTLAGLLQYFLTNHNSSVDTKKQFTLGTVTVTDDNNYVRYTNSEYSTTLDAIRSKLIDTHGGYLRVRFSGGVKYLDYLADFNERSVQTVEYGKNLLDVKIIRDHTQRVSALIPLGAKLTATDENGTEVESDTRLDITSVNDGRNYLSDEAAVAEIGWVWACEIWANVTLASNLKTKGAARLAELAAGVTSMELTIVDESDTGADIGSIHARQYIDCISAPHGINGRYLCVSKREDYLNPAGNTITIGASGVKLTAISAKQNQNIAALESDILGQESKITEAVNTAHGAADGVSALRVNVQECYSEITKTSEQIQSSVRETYISKTDLEAIQQDFQTSITQSSTEIRMDFTSVTDEIKGSVAANQELLEEYIRFKGALIELGKVGNAFTAELSNEQLAFKENGQIIAYISNQSLVITNAEIRYRLSLGTEDRGWFDFIPRASGNLSIVWRGPNS